MRVMHGHLKGLLTFTSVLLLSVLTVAGQTTYKLHITHIKIPEQKETTWYGRPLTCDFIVSWDLFMMGEDGNLVRTATEIDSQVSSYKVYMLQKIDSKDHVVSEQQLTHAMVAAQIDSAVFADQAVGPRYYFYVEGELNNEIIQSDTAWAVSGKPQLYAQMASGTGAQDDAEKQKYQIPLFFPLAELLDSLLDWRSDIYHESTPLGRASFTLIWYFFLFSMLYILPFRCLKGLHLGRLFPFTKMSFFKAYFNKDNNYKTCLATRFRFVVEAWKRVIINTNRLIRDVEAADLGVIDETYYKHFREHSAPALEVLQCMLSFNPKKDDGEALTEEIKKYFGKGAVFGDIISKPFTTVSWSDEYTLNWYDVQKDLLDPNSKPLHTYPTARLLAAGLENHIINGFQRQDTFREVDRAIENRAASEIELLRERSAVDWLWNFGALAPLLGLFGTVTGISTAFGEITKIQGDMSQLDMVRQLSGGIFEALWTTIYGLIAGIVLMIIHYYFKNTLEWIYNKWQSLAVHVSEKL